MFNKHKQMIQDWWKWMCQSESIFVMAWKNMGDFSAGKGPIANSRSYKNSLCCSHECHGNQI